MKYTVKLYAEISAVTTVTVESDSLADALDRAESEVDVDDFLPVFNKKAEVYLEKITQSEAE